jgi:predicted nucleotide-binding protein
MFNLFVSADEGAWEQREFKLEAERFLEYTDDEYIERFKSLDTSTKNALLAVPALFAYETPVAKRARVGALKTIQTGGGYIGVTFEFDAAIEPIEPGRLQALTWELQIDKLELNRTHWAVKDRDLFAALRAAGVVSGDYPAERPAASPDPEFSRATLLSACDLLQALGHAGLDRFLLEVGVSGLNAGKDRGGLAPRANAIAEFVVNNPRAKTLEGEPIGLAVVRKAADVDREYPNDAPQYVSARTREGFWNGLRRDGYEVRGGEIVSTCVAATAPAIQNYVSAPPRAQALQAQGREISTAADDGKIFIGHGRSAAWRDLKDLLRERLALSPVEFNMEPSAGMTTTERLQEMLDAAAFAFLVLTGEDQHADGAHHARENVIHEAGLFQGRLGFRRAIILLEDGCIEFSNIYGLGQIRFPKGNIMAKSEEIREVLEREGLLPRR